MGMTSYALGTLDYPSHMSEEQKAHHKWIAKIIISCKNPFQFSCVDRLIELYLEKHGDEDSAFDLQIARTEQWNTIHSILT